MAPSRLIYGQDVEVAQWVKDRLPDFLGWNGAYIAIGYEREGRLQGGVVFTDYTRASITISTALEAPLTRRFLRGIFWYPFKQLHVRRITALIHSNNEASRRLAEHAGFIQEGIVRHGAFDGDVVLYGMLKSECRFL